MVGSSLLSVSVFGASTAANYALSGFVLWGIAGWMILGGVFGGALGVWASRKLAARRAILQRLFAGFVLIVAVWVAYNALAGAHGS